MSSILENRYKIKLIIKNDDEDYVQALKIYNDETPPEIKTESNQITYWINKDTSNFNFKFMIFTAYLDNEVIGFAEIAYFNVQPKFALIDYMTFKKVYKVNAVFFPIFNLIQNYMNNNSLHVDYWITEINHKEDGANIDKESAFFKKLICIENFGSISTDYFHPSLGDNNYESSFIARLYIKTNDSLKQLSKQTVLFIIKTIYYSYYWEWYKPFSTVDAINSYKQHLDINFEKIKKNLIDQANVSVECSNCMLAEVNSQSTSGIVPAKKVKKKFTLPLILTAVILSPLIIMLLYYQIFKLLGFNLGSTTMTPAVATILGAAISGSIGIWSTTRKKSD
ncbi:hypothetical protein [Paenibacillus durus]|uniref:Uncharacterized protein n=1 Tax=Paenibacillus durus ATCC 35681 TaxID=1333534 RepID=A0A0F7F8A5_PAEDU|nr:hypothetical protein [Paenibacillus durus]AKG34323.1 hypothetical protein VK70_06840 [Paenibacillus durus ATCC 35681]